MSRLNNAWRDRTTRILVLSVVALIVVFGALHFAGVTSGGSPGKTDRYGLTQAECRALFNGRIGHSPQDNAFWDGLVDCADKGLLPAGQNNPGYYAP